MTTNRRIVSIPQWASIANLADDGKTLATARGLLARGDGPPVTRIGKRNGVQIEAHEKWLQTTPWAQYLATLPQPERHKRAVKALRIVGDAAFVARLYDRYLRRHGCLQMTFEKWVKRRQRLKDRHSPRPRSAQGGVNR